MAAGSKHVRLDQIFSGHDCKDFYHTWTTSCKAGIWDMYLRSLKGSAQFFAAIYLLQLITNKRKANRECLKHHVKSFLRSVLFGNSMTTFFLVFGCMFRKLFGKFYHYSIAFLPATTSGFSICFEQQGKREFYLCAYFTLTLEYIFRRLMRAGIVKLTKLKKCISFMLLSSTVMYLLRSDSMKNLPNGVSYWFFIPPRGQIQWCRERDLEEGTHKIQNCYHSGTCWSHAFLDSFKYLGFGVALQMLRSLLPLSWTIFFHPIDALQTVCVWKNFALGFFLGGFIGIYHVVNCLLCQYRGHDSQMHAIPAGLLAGAAFWFQPKLTILVMAPTTIFQQLIWRGIALGIIPRSAFLLSTAFALLHGILVQSRLVDADICHHFIYNMLATCSGGRCEEIYASYLKLRDNYHESS